MRVAPNLYRAHTFHSGSPKRASRVTVAGGAVASNEDTAKASRILIIVQNLPVPLDRRVWLECQALRAEHYEVTVICPKGPGDPGYQEIDGVKLYKYAPPPAASGALTYLFEFVYCWIRTAWLSVKAWRRNRFDVIQACNPPDTYWALAKIYKLVGVRFVYDQHDLNPELFRSRFGEPSGTVARLQFAVLSWLERMTYHTADHVISTNESYRDNAITRGGVARENATVFRSGHSTARMRPIECDAALRNGREYLLAYLGVMGPQDGVDLVLRVADVLVNQWCREDVQVALLGFGDSYESLVSMAHDLGLDDYVTFTGRVGPAEIASYLSSADIGICPDPLSPLNDVSTMNKTMEYMSYALPVVAFDLTETRVTGADAVAYVPAVSEVDHESVEVFAKAVADLLDDPERRADMAIAGRRRAERFLDWAPQRDAYVGVYNELTGERASAVLKSLPDPVPVAPPGTRWIDVADDNALRAFVVGRPRSARKPGRPPVHSPVVLSAARRTG